MKLKATLYTTLFGLYLINLTFAAQIKNNNNQTLNLASITNNYVANNSYKGLKQITNKNYTVQSHKESHSTENNNNTLNNKANELNKNKQNINYTVHTNKTLPNNNSLQHKPLIMLAQNKPLTATNNLLESKHTKKNYTVQNNNLQPATNMLKTDMECEYGVCTFKRYRKRSRRPVFSKHHNQQRSQY